MRVIDTPFVYYLTWHREKNRGTEIKPRVEVRKEESEPLMDSRRREVILGPCLGAKLGQRKGCPRMCVTTTELTGRVWGLGPLLSRLLQLQDATLRKFEREIN